MQSIQQLIDDITLRPQMWVDDGRFVTAAGFINGYDWATQQFTVIPREQTDLGRFRTWLAERFNKSHSMAPNMGWEYYICEVWSEDVDRFEQLRLLFHECLSEQVISHPSV